MLNPRVSTALLREMYEKDRLSTRQIELATGIKRSTVARRLRAAGVELRKRSSAMLMRSTRVSVAELRRLYSLEGRSTREVAAILNTSTGRVKSLLRRHGIPVRLPAKCSAYSDSRYEREPLDGGELVYDYAVVGLSAAKTGRKQGVSSSTARKMLRRLGVVISPKVSERVLMTSALHAA